MCVALRYGLALPRPVSGRAGKWECKGWAGWSCRCTVDGGRGCGDCSPAAAVEVAFRRGYARACACRCGTANADGRGGAMGRSRVGILLLWNDLDQGNAAAATSRAGGDETGHCMAGAVSIRSNVSPEAGHGPACGDEHSADAACGGARSLDCSSAERESGRWCSGGASKRGVSTRDAGALRRSTSAMNCVREPGRSIGTSNTSRDAAAYSAVLAKLG